MTRTWPETAPSLNDHAYMMFTLDTSEQSAAAKFQDRHGQQPEWIVEYLGWLYVGPIPERKP